MIRVAIIGASGYTGSEAIEIILKHPQAEVTYLTALPEECGGAGDVFGRLKGRCGLEIEPLNMEKLSELADVVLCCLPHKVSMGFVPRLLEAGVKVIDFSADYRLKNVDTYQHYYQEHTDVENLNLAVYGLPELFREQIAGAELVANPGCFPTGASLAAAPLLKDQLIKEQIIVNAVTGASGAGKNPSAKFHFPNMNENIFAYGIGTHRHTPEIEQIASGIAGTEVSVLFQPHVGPFDRGIYTTLYCEPLKQLNDEELLSLFEEFYTGEPFVQVCRCAPNIKDVAGTNYCHICPVNVKGRTVIFSAIDNLVKGASGQAIQNMNIMFGLEETMGLL